MKIKSEKKVVRQMIEIYCRAKHGGTGLESCSTCRELVEYCHARLARCPHGDGKPSCQRCTIHCYSPERREQIRAVMRYSGPRMMLYHPISAMLHLLRR